GSLAIVNKEAFLEQSISTLVAAMRANRAKVYAVIRAGMAKQPGEYIISEAHKDVLEYLRAGTLTEGMTFVVAKTKETSEADIAQARADIESVVALSDVESRQAFCMSKSLEALGPADRTRLLAVYRQVNPNPPDGPMQDIVDAFSRAYVNEPQVIREYFAAMQRADLLLKPCPEDQ
ncbi:MAG TPA: hypothetical protein VJ724_03105, partial [Tahibacter sp.]|nr:hypothetical protein [Tahibacter sp.]